MIKFSREISVSEICRLTGGQVVAGSRETSARYACALDVFSDGALTFANSANSKATEKVLGLSGRALSGVVLASFTPDAVDLKVTIVKVNDPRLAFIKVLRAVAPREEDGRPTTTFVHPTAIVHPDAVIGAQVFIGPYCVIGKVKIGDRTRLHSHVSLRNGVELGADCIVCEHTVIGKDGFGYQKDETGAWLQFPHFGGVVVEDGVHIGSSTTIDQGVMGPTTIGAGSRIDNLVHIAHNVQLGRHNIVVACAEISGSVKTGEQCWIGPNGSILNGVSLGNDVFVGIRGLVLENIPDSHRISPARDTIKKNRSVT